MRYIISNKETVSIELPRHGRKGMKMTEINLNPGGGTEQYLKPQMEVIDLNKEDIVTASGGCTPVDAPAYDDWFG